MKSFYNFMALTGYRIVLIVGMVLIGFLVAVLPR